MDWVGETQPVRSCDSEEFGEGVGGWGNVKAMSVKVSLKESGEFDDVELEEVNSRGERSLSS